MSLRFEVVGNEAERADLAERQEHKYVFRCVDPATLRHVLEGFCRPIIYAERVSRVQSVYFDCRGLSTAYANLAGLARRHKVRLRWYDRDQPAHDAWLEIKWRNNRVTGKKRVRLASSESLEGVAYRRILEALRRDAPPGHATALSRLGEPVALVEYRREHYAAFDSPARMTLDYDLRFARQVGQLRLTRRFAEHARGLVIIEAKVLGGDMTTVRRLATTLNARPARFSKYVYGCDRLNLLHAG